MPAASQGGSRLYRGGDRTNLHIFGVARGMSISTCKSFGAALPAIVLLCRGSSASSCDVVLSPVPVRSAFGAGKSSSGGTIQLAVWRLPYFEDDILVINNVMEAEMNNNVLEVT